MTPLRGPLQAASHRGPLRSFSEGRPWAVERVSCAPDRESVGSAARLPRGEPLERNGAIFR